MFEFFIPIPLDAPQEYKRSRGVSIKRTKFTTSGRFVAVKDYTYIKVARRIGERQVGINFFYLVDNGIIIGYRKNDHYFLRRGAHKNVKAKRKGVIKHG